MAASCLSSIHAIFNVWRRPKQRSLPYTIVLCRSILEHGYMDDDTAISACKAKMFQPYYNTTIYAEHLRIFTSHIALAMKMAFSLSAVFTLSTPTGSCLVPQPGRGQENTSTFNFSLLHDLNKYQ